MRIIIVLTCLFLFSFFCYLFSQSGWFWQNPRPQGNTLNDLFVFDDSTAIAVGDLGTVIKTYDGGISWDIQHFAGGTSNSINAVQFANDNDGWAVGGRWHGEGIILKTNDGGSHWDSVYSSPSALFDLFFTDQFSGWAVGKDGTVLSTDNGGQTWNFTPVPVTTLSLNSVFFTNPDIGWIAGEEGIIFKTTDGGSIWTSTSIDSAINSIYFINADTGWCCGYNHISKTTDGGITWNLQFSGTANSLQSVHFNDADTGFVVGTEVQGWLYKGCLLKTTDGGVTWDISYQNCNLNSVNFKVNHTGWIVGNQGLIFKTSNNGLSWDQKTSMIISDYSFNSVDFVNSNVGWAVGGNSWWGKNLIVKTENGGQTWTIQDSGRIKSILNSVNFHDQDIGYAVGSFRDLWVPGGLGYGTILKTSNGGVTWDSLNPALSSLWNSVFFISADTGWVAGGYTTYDGYFYYDYRHIIKTIDGGLGWQTQLEELGDYCTSIYFSNSDTGYVATDYALLKTNDGGASWDFIPFGFDLRQISIHFLRSDIGWLIGYDYLNDRGIILKTDDGGTTWSQQFSIDSLFLNSVYFIDENHGWVVGDNIKYGIILKTVDGGLTWNYKQSASSGLNSVFFTDTNTGWAVGANETILKTTTGGVVDINREFVFPFAIPRNLELAQNYPNPFNPFTTIRYSLPQNAKVILKIYNLLGQEVKTLVNGYQTAGEKTVVWDGKSEANQQLSSGIYIYRLQVGNQIKSRKMVHIK